MKRVAIALVATAGTFLGTHALAQVPDDAATLAARAAEALGGRDRIQALRTLRIIGYGELIDGEGLSNISAGRYTPVRLNNLLEWEREIDLQNMRMRTQHRRRTNFTFANVGGNLGINKVIEVIDGSVAYNVAANGTATRARADAVIEWRLRMFSHPVTAVRAALDPRSILGPVRNEEGTAVFSVTTSMRDEFDLAVDPRSGLPVWVRWIRPQINFGEVTYTVHFDAWMPVNGIQLPQGFTTIQDWRNQVQKRLYIDRNILDAPIADLAAPANLVTPQGPGGGGAPPEPVRLADGVWRLGGSTVFEFADHMVMYEVNGSEAAVLARIDQAGTLVPGKPLTHAIMSHHHDDHATGLRTAVSRGLTIIAHHSIEDTFRELTERKTTKYHDALSRSYQPLKFVPVHDHLELKDARMEVDVYHVINNNHMATGVIAHVPAHRILVEADLTTPNWDYQWWGGSLLDNIEHRGIEVDVVSPVHGPVSTVAVMQADIERQVQGARDLCAKAEAAQLYRPGCPVQYTRE